MSNGTLVPVVTVPEIIKLVHRERRAAEMSAGIMRDPRRTGRWAGAENTANAFERIANRLAVIECLLARQTPSKANPDE